MLECRYVHISGKKCRALAINSGALCHRHKSMRRTLALGSPRQLANDTKTLDYGSIPVPAMPSYDQTLILPPIDDLASIQLAISRVIQALAANTLDPKRAGLLLYGLQIAHTTTAAMERMPHGHYQFTPTVLVQKDGTPLAPPQQEEEEDYEEDESEEAEEGESEQEEESEEEEESVSQKLHGETFAQSATRLRQILHQIDHP
jgi:hypothetical protein